jgi:hypothetical protein
VVAKMLLQILVAERIRQVAYVQFIAHGRTPRNNLKTRWSPYPKTTNQ